MAICRCGYLSEGGTSPVAAKGFVKSSLIQPFQGIQQGYAIGYDFYHSLNVTAKVDKFMSVLNLLFAGGERPAVTLLSQPQEILLAS